MKIKRFRARTFAEALEIVKKELSDEAVILSTEEKKGLRPYVEVTAAVDYEQGSVKRSSTGLSREESAHDPGTASKYKNLDLGTIPPFPLEDIKREIEKIRETLEDMRFCGFNLNLNEKRRKVFQILRTKGIKEEFALRLCERAKSTEDIIEAIRSDVKDLGLAQEASHDPTSRPPKTFSLFNIPRIIMLIGPTGVGKTTTVAKLASLAIKERKRVALINLDTYRIGAPEQIRTYARILGIPIHMASNARELKEGLRRFSGERDLIFIDTTGRNPMDEGYINEIRSLCTDIREDKEISSEYTPEIHLLMNTNSDSDYMIEAYKYYRLLPLNYIGLTKIDEAVRYGNIYNMIMTYQRPVAYVTTGQKVPDDIEFPEIDRIAGLILKGYQRTLTDAER